MTGHDVCYRQGLILGVKWVASHPLYLLVCTGYYGNRSIIAYQSLPIIQYSEVQVATHSAPPPPELAMGHGNGRAPPMEYFWISA